MTFVAVDWDYGASESTMKINVEVLKTYSEAFSRWVSNIAKVQKDQFFATHGVICFSVVRHAEGVPSCVGHSLFTSIYRTLLMQKIEKIEFNASKDWVQKLLARQTVVSMAVSGKAASADMASAIQYPEFHHVITNQSLYDLCQISMPTRLHCIGSKCLIKLISQKKMPICQALRLQKTVSLLLCTNEAWDYKCKPSLPYCSAHPWALKNIS